MTAEHFAEYQMFIQQACERLKCTEKQKELLKEMQNEMAGYRKHFD